MSCDKPIFLESGFSAIHLRVMIVNIDEALAIVQRFPQTLITWRVDTCELVEVTPLERTASGATERITSHADNERADIS